MRLLGTTGSPATQLVRPLSPQSTSPGRRVDFVDVLRALAALYVATYHALLVIWPASGPRPPWYLRFADYGHFGVTAFIVLSGFSLALRPARRNDNSAGRYWAFIKKRGLRLLPAYWLALLGSVAILALSPAGVHAAAAPGEWTGKGAVPASSIFVFGFLVQDVVRAVSPNSPFWSIAVEWHLYFLFPALLFLGRRYGMRGLLATSVVAAVGLHFALLHTSAIGTTPQFLALFCFGLAAAYVMADFSGGRYGPRQRVLVRFERVGGAGLRQIGWSLLLVSWVTFMFMARYEMAADLVSGAIFTSGLLLIGCGARAGQEAASPGRLRRALAGVGLFSYSLYLVHSPTEKIVWTLVVSHFGQAKPVEFVALWLLGVGASVAAAYVFYLIIERRSQEWSKRVSTDPVPTVTPQVATT